MQDATPGWRLLYIGVDGVVPALGFNLWKTKWRPVPPGKIVVPHPSYPRQRHDFDTYECDGRDGTLRFAVGEFSNNIWGVFIPE